MACLGICFLAEEKSQSTVVENQDADWFRRTNCVASVCTGQSERASLSGWVINIFETLKDTFSETPNAHYRGTGYPV